MSPPPPSSDYSASRQSIRMAAEDLRRIRWAGWSILGVMLASWASWSTLLTIAHTSEIALVTERENQHFQTLQKQLDEIKSDVKQLLRRSGGNHDQPD